jgi:hypothetical protein
MDTISTPSYTLLQSSLPFYGERVREPIEQQRQEDPFLRDSPDRCSSSGRLWDWSLRSVERSRGERRGLSCIEFMQSLGDHTNQVRNPGSFHCFPIQVFPRMSILPFPSEWMQFAPDYLACEWILILFSLRFGLSLGIRIRRVSGFDLNLCCDEWW